MRQRVHGNPNSILQLVRSALSRCRIRSRRRRAAAVASSPQCLEARELLTIEFRFDYSLDTSGFFDQPGAKTALERAASILESRITDTLDPIVPSGGNTWDAVFKDPSTGNDTRRTDLQIEANEILIFAGARNLGGTLAQGGWGGYSWQGTAEWGDTVAFRGEVDNGTDFGPWGGTLTFSTARTWHFGLTVEGLDSNEEDFISIAAHELSHALGFAAENASFARYVSGNSFRGPRSVSEYDGSGNVPLDSDGDHWQPGITDNGQETALDSSVTTGTRELMTFLDFAGLDDIGWDVDARSTDWGDAPADRYPTLSADNGARHTIKSGLYLGGIADADANGQASDDNDELDDDDGVEFQTDLLAGAEARVDVTANRAGKINAWIDFNLDGDWADAGEQILDDVDVGAGTNPLTFDVPANAISGTSWARFRLNSTGNLSFIGGAPDGEVEDYAVDVIDGVFASDDSASVAAGGSVNIDVLANDTPTGSVQVIGFTQADQGTVGQMADGRLQFIADADASGNTTFDYTIAKNQAQIAGAAAGDELGRSTVVVGDTLIVSAEFDDTTNGANAGTVRVYRRNGEAWVLVQTLQAPDAAAGDRFGSAIATDDNTLVISALTDDDNGSSSGSAYVFDRTDAVSDFSFTQKLLGIDGRRRDLFGGAVAIDGRYIAVGSRLDDDRGSSSGAVEVFFRNNAGTWVSQQKIAPDTLEQGDQFGSSVALTGSTLLVGARRDNYNGRVNVGSVYVLTRTGNTWSVTKQVLSPKQEIHAFFGWSVALLGDRIVVGQPARDRPSRTGRAFIFERNVGGTNNWGLVRRIDPTDGTPGNRFGYSVAISGSYIAVGSPRMNDGGVRSGEVRVYERNTGGANNWGLLRTLNAADASGGDDFGFSVAFSGDQILVGARREDTGGLNAGSLFVDDLRTDVGRVTVTIT